MRDIMARLKKMESAIGSKPVYVTYTDTRGNLRERYPLSNLQYALRSQVDYMWFELQPDKDTMNPVPMVDFTIPDCEIIPLLDQLHAASKFAEGVTLKAINHCRAGLLFVARGWIKTGKNEHYLMGGVTLTDFDEDMLSMWFRLMYGFRLALEDGIRGGCNSA